MRATAIVGPADVGRCLARFHRIEGVEWTSGLEERADAVVIFGGDGTVHRHLSALVDLNLPGLVVEITRRANELPKWIRAHGGYALCAPREFFRFLPFPMKITYNNGAADKFQPTILAAVANAPTYGGGMRIAPHARLDDGKLD